VPPYDAGAPSSDMAWDKVDYPYEFWNVYSRFEENNIPCSTNSLEGWHLRINLGSLPNMGKSMEMLRKEEIHWHLECQNITAGLR